MDLEIKAMSDCYESLSGLDDASKTRVIQWLISKYDLAAIAKPIAKSVQEETIHILPEPTDEGGTTTHRQSVAIADFAEVADIFTKAQPKTDADKVLVVAAFLQIKGGLTDFVSFDVQKELKHLGHGVSNITSSIGQLESKKPKLVVQTRKDGKSKQAKKRYKVTHEGLNAVKEMIKGD